MRNDPVAALVRGAARLHPLPSLGNPLAVLARGRAFAPRQSLAVERCAAVGAMTPGKKLREVRAARFCTGEGDWSRAAAGKPFCLVSSSDAPIRNWPRC